MAAAVAESVRARVERSPVPSGSRATPGSTPSGTGSDDVVYLLEINSLCGLTEATVFYSQWLADADPLPPWAVLDRIVEAGLERFARPAPPPTGPPGPADGRRPAPR